MNEIPLSDYQYHLPEERIAFYPPAERGSSKLLVYRDRKISHRSFKDLPELLPENSLLIFNESRVIPARIKTATAKGKPIELFLLKPVAHTDPFVALNTRQHCDWECMVGRRKDWKESEAIRMSVGGVDLEVTWKNRNMNHVRFSWNPGHLTFADVLEAIGKVPLPPYIVRDAEARDKQAYQTVYSKTEGSVAAPTAGLHFTDEILETICRRGHQIDFVTLHVGAGTFMPVKTDNMLQHEMHTELISVRKELVDKLARHTGAIISVGTTSLRTLESLWHIGVSEDDTFGRVGQFPATSSSGLSMREAMQRLSGKMSDRQMQTVNAETAIMIYPGYRIHACDALVTNFHQPGSTLLMLVSALVGENWKTIYGEALRNDYRFLSYGDSSLLFYDKD